MTQQGKHSKQNAITLELDDTVTGSKSIKIRPEENNADADMYIL